MSSALLLSQETDGHFSHCNFQWEKYIDALLYAVPLTNLEFAGGKVSMHVYNEIAA